MKTVSFTEFRKRASGLLTEVENGEILVVMRHGRPIAEISPFPAEQRAGPSWKRPALRLSVQGADLSQAILDERETT